MSTPFTKVRFSASFVKKIGGGTRKTRRFVGTCDVREGTDNLAAVVIGMISGVAREEHVEDADAIQIRASVVGRKQ